MQFLRQKTSALLPVIFHCNIYQTLQRQNLNNCLIILYQSSNFVQNFLPIVRNIIFVQIKLVQQT